MTRCFIFVCILAVNYKQLMCGEGDPLLLLTPLLSSSNVHVVAKVASKIPCQVNMYNLHTTPLKVWIHPYVYSGVLEKFDLSFINVMHCIFFVGWRYIKCWNDF